MAVVRVCTDLLLNMHNRCLTQGVFLREMECLRKDNGHPMTASAYRLPIYAEHAWKANSKA